MWLLLALTGSVRVGAASLGPGERSEPLNAREHFPEMVPTLTAGLTRASAFSAEEAPAGGREQRWDIGAAVGVGLGHSILGSSSGHDFALSKFHMGRPLTEVVGTNHWYRGAVEFLGEVTVGAQFNPRTAYLVAFTPVVRYELATGTRLTPFVDAGAGIGATDIGSPDLSSTFQFNLQAGWGLRWRWSRRTAVTLQYRFLHVSNAGLRRPNLGVNSSVLYVGISRFF